MPPQVLFFIFHCMYSLECVIQTGSVQFWNSSSQHCLPREEMADLSHVQSIETDAWELQLLREDSRVSTTSVRKYTADLIPLQSDFCLFNLWIPKQISVWSRCHFFFLHWLIFRGRLSDSWRMEIVMEHLEATCRLDRSWKECLLKNWHCKGRDERYICTLFLNLEVQVLMDNLSFLFFFFSKFQLCLLPYTVTESLCQVFSWYN